MNTRFRTMTAAFVAASTALLGAYALAQPQPAPGSEKKPGGMMQGGGMHDGMHGAKMDGCMMGGGMDGDLADVRIEKTKTGAVIRLSAKSPGDTEKVQRMALMAAIHLGADPAALMPPAAEPRPAKP